MSPRLPQMASLPVYRQCSWSAAVRRALHGPGRIFIVESILDVSRASPPLYVGATATAEVGTLRLCWLRMSPKPRGDSERHACKHHLLERPQCGPFSGAGGGRVSFATAAANAVRA